MTACLIDDVSVDVKVDVESVTMSMSVVSLLALQKTWEMLVTNMRAFIVTSLETWLMLRLDIIRVGEDVLNVIVDIIFNSH